MLLCAYNANAIGPFKNVRSVAVNPNHSNIVLAGDDYEGTYRSTDGGNTWVEVFGQSASGIAFSPSDNDIIYINRGFKSTDGGDSWIVLPNMPSGKYISVNPINPDELFVSSGTGTIVYYSIDGGFTWNELDIPNGSGYSNAQYAPNGEGNIIYVTPFGNGIYKSTDGGQSWHYYSTDGSSNVLQIDPTNSDVVYVGYYWPSGNDDYGLRKTTDGGNNWMYLGFGDHNIYNIRIRNNNPQNVWVCTDNGLYKSVDGGDSFSHSYYWLGKIKDCSFSSTSENTIFSAGPELARSLDNGESWAGVGISVENRIEKLVVDRSSNHHVYATAWLDDFYKSEDLSDSWFSIMRSVKAFSFDHSDFGDIYVIYLYNELFKSSDDGFSWNLLGETPFVAAFYCVSSLLFYACYDDVFYRSSDGGYSWVARQIASDIYVDELMVDQASPEYIYVGTNNGIYRSTDSGDSWLISLESDGHLQDVEMDPNNANILYATLWSEGIMKSVNYGQTWSFIHTGPPSIEKIVVSFNDSLKLYGISGDNYLCRSIDGGYSWIRTDIFVGNISNHSIAVDYWDDNFVYVNMLDGIQRIYLGTTNIREDNSLPFEYSHAQNYPNPFNAATTISYTLPHPANVTLDIYNILGRKVKTLYDGNQPAGSHSLIWNADGFASGVYFYKLTAGEYKHAQKMMLLK